MIEVGDIWRRCGPCEWVRVMEVHLPGYDNYDGALPGVSVNFTSSRGKWLKRRWFIACKDEAQFVTEMEKMFRWKVPAETKVENFDLDLLPEHLRILRDKPRQPYPHLCA